MNGQTGSGQTALVTGASAGIGIDLAECFARDGYELIIAARTESALKAVGERISNTHRVKVTAITCDLEEIGGGAKLAAEIARRGLSVDVLVNNAGFGHAGGFAWEPIAPQLGMIDLNVRALTELTHIYWKRMLDRGQGGVLNVASTAAFQPGPLMAVYYASKAYVLSFSEALWEEARGTGVHVSCLCPGPTASKFRDRAGTGKTRLGKTMAVMPSMPVAEAGYQGFVQNKRVVVTGGRNKLLVGATRMLPRTAVLRTVRRMQEQA